MDFSVLVDLNDRELEVLMNAIKQLLESRKLQLDGKNKETSAVHSLKKLGEYLKQH